MDANVPQDFTYQLQDANPQEYVVENMSEVKSPLLFTEDKVYAVVMPTQEVDGRTVTSFDLADSVKEMASEQEISKILQYNDGSTKIVDTEHMYIPEGMSKEDSVRFMRKIGADLMLEGRLGDNQETLELGERLVTYANRLGMENADWQRGLPGVEEARTDMPDWQKGLPGTNEYTAQEVQSVFNALAEREPAMQGKVPLELFNYELKQFNEEIKTREEMTPVLHAFSNHMKTDRQATAEYQLASVERASEQEIGKILQYGGHNVKIADTENMFIPEYMSEQESLAFMHKMGSRIVEQGITDNNQSMVNAGKQLVSCAMRMEKPREDTVNMKNGYPYFGKPYDKEEIQSVFNAIAEREPSLRTDASLKLFEETLIGYEKDLALRKTMEPVMLAYSQRIANDLEHSPMHEFYSTFNNREDAIKYARENGPRKTVTRFSEAENARMGDQIGQETYRVYGSISPRPYVVENSNKAFSEQLALDSIISGYKKDGARGYGYYRDRDKDGKLMVSGISHDSGKEAEYTPLRRDFASSMDNPMQEIPKFKFENKGKAKTGSLAIVEERDRNGNLKKNDMEKHYAGLSRDFT